MIILADVPSVVIIFVLFLLMGSMAMHSSGYWKTLSVGIQTLRAGLRLTFRHIWASRKTVREHDVRSAKYFANQQGIATIQYPHQTIPVPEVGRYQLHNEIDDCIVCDKCAKICPVNCITIEPIKSATEIGKTSDGTPKRIHAATFDIDMAKCCFCGLCTTVCPTECLTMTPVFDYSALDIREHNFAFGNLSPEQVSAYQREWDLAQQAKAAAAPPTTGAPPASSGAKPVFKPRIKPAGPPPSDTTA